MFQVEFLQRAIVGEPGDADTLSVTDTSTPTDDPLSVGMYEVVSDVACHLAFGATPTASATTMYLPANFIYPFTLHAAVKMAVIRHGSVDGTLWFWEKKDKEDS
jgi:hypothetical protein